MFHPPHRRGFDSVTVAEIARNAEVSEVTVFNYFPTKEDLFYGGMEFFEEQLIEAVRSRARGESALAAFRRRLLEGADGLATRERLSAIKKAAQMISKSPDLVARERDIIDSHTRRFATVLAEEAGAAPNDIEALAVAGALMVVHRMLVDHIRGRVLAEKRGSELVVDFRAEARKAFRRLERGLGDFAVKS